MKPKTKVRSLIVMACNAFIEDINHVIFLVFMIFSPAMQVPC